MRLLIQRVLHASVSVDGRVVGAIQAGALVFFGAHKQDVMEQAKELARKLCDLRFCQDAEGRANYSLKESRGAVLIVSQFTLYGNCHAGRRPGFTDAAPGPVARALYEAFVEAVKREGIPVQTGEFGALMQVSLMNEGPFTLIMDAKQPSEEGFKAKIEQI